MLRFLFVIILVILLFVWPKSPTRADILNENCYALGQLAEVIMRDRQQDMSLTEVLQTHVLSQDPRIQVTARDIVIQAFQRQGFSNPRSQETLNHEFRNQIELECYLAESEETS